MEFPKSILGLIDNFSSLPGIGKKTAERLALHIYSNSSDEEIERFSKNLIDVKKNLHHCKVCGNLTENDICSICSDLNRDHSQVMVVENIKDLFIIERLQAFNGVYHVLGGAIDFSNGIGVEDIDISGLIERVKTGTIKELILACNATLEGETTSRYIKALLEDYDVKITRIAHGLPVGGDIAYADQTTILKALEGRRKYE